MKVEGTLAALVAITAALTIGTSHPHTQPVHAQASAQVVDNPVPHHDDVLRASRSRSLTTQMPPQMPPKDPTYLKKPKIGVSKIVPRSKSLPKPHVKRFVRPSVSINTPWAHTPDAFRVSNCESGDRHTPDVASRYNGNAHLRGFVSGKWQMDPDFWRTYGGLKFAARASDATESEQDAVAHAGYLVRGWQPWSCSRIMGVR